MRIIQIVPRLAPALDGVGDYSLILAQRLRRVAGIDTAFIVCDSTWEGPKIVDEFKVLRISSATSEALVVALNDICDGTAFPADHVLLQFVSYGYQRRGCPIWLIRGLKKWRHQSSGKLLTMFHELDADSSPPWSSAYWLCPLQRFIIKELAALSNCSCTNTMRYKEKLSSWGVGNIYTSPTFSNIGEPTNNALIVNRERQLIVFGRPWQRERTYLNAREHLKVACDRVHAEAIIDIGGPMHGFDSPFVEGIPVVRLGKLPADQVSKLLLSSRASFVYYPEDLLTKSGVYAASCSHGAIPFVSNDSGEARVGTELVRGLDYLSAEYGTATLELDEMQKLSDGVFQRYQHRSSRTAAELFAKLIS